MSKKIKALFGILAVLLAFCNVTALAEDAVAGCLEKLMVVHNMNIKQQEGKEYYPVHVYTGIDSLNYKEVGFKIRATNTTTDKSAEKATKVVYTSMTVTDQDGNKTLYDASMLGGMYMFGQEIVFNKDLWKNEDTTLYVTPYAISMDGKEITGKTTTISDAIIKGVKPDSALFREIADTEEGADGDVIASGSTDVTVNGNVTETDSAIFADGASAEIPAGVTVEDGTTELVLSVATMSQSKSDVAVGENEEMASYDVKVAGVAKDNNVPIIVTVDAMTVNGLNDGNIAVYHVEADGTKAMTKVASIDEVDEHNTYYYNPVDGTVTLALANFSEVSVVAETDRAWEGNFDYNWYDASKEELTIANADQLAGLSAIVGGMVGQTQDSFAGKTIKLVADINLADAEEKNNSNLIFYPIGYYNSEGTYERTNTAITSGLRNFEGTFDGNGHTIANFYHNTWEMKGDHDWYTPEEQYYRDGMGLFGRIYGGTVKNLTVKNFKSDGEIATTGVIAAYADFGATFENIAIFDCNPRVYNIGNGGIVGCVGWYTNDTTEKKVTFKNITVDNSNKISALWGSYDVACGGLVGQYYPTSGQTNSPKNAGIHMENCHVSAQIDVYNDVCANYQYYAYRYAGMLIGSVRENVTIDGHVYPKMDGITAKDCTVHFGTWNDYYYCELVANSLASYTHDHQFSRLTQVDSVDLEKMTVTVGKTTTDIPTSGRVNYVVVNGKHATENATCYHFVDGAVWSHEKEGTEIVNGVEVLKENNQHIYLEFNNLITGYGWGVTSKAIKDFEGIEILDIKEGNQEESVVKFAKAETAKDSYETESTVTIGELFGVKEDSSVDIMPANIQVAVSPVGDDSTAGGTYVANTTDWKQGTLTFTGVGAATITIQDYYFCTPTTITVNVTKREPKEKFETKFTGDFLYRVGNQNAVALGSLFAPVGEDTTFGTVTVNVENKAGNASGPKNVEITDNWQSVEIKFEGTGVVKVTIKDDDQYCTPTVLNLEVVEAVNATGATSATANNVVLLNDCGFSSLEVSGGYTLFGNGFTMTCGSDSPALDTGYAFVTLDNGILDNVQIVLPNFDYAVLYDTNKKESGNRSQTTDKIRYYNVKSGVMASGNSQILNSRISGARAAVNASGGNLLIDNSRIELGAVASLLVGAANSVTLRDVTLVQKPTASTYDPSKILMGFSVLAIANGNGDAAPITIEGSLTQWAWANEEYKKYVPASGASVVNLALAEEDYLHDINGKKSLNLGFAYMPEDTYSPLNNPFDEKTKTITDSRTNKNTIPYDCVHLYVPGTSGAYVYSYKNTNGTDDSYKTESGYVPNKYGDVVSVSYADTADGITTGKSYSVEDGWAHELNVDLDKLPGYKLDFSKLSMTVNGVPKTDYKVNTAAKPTSSIEVTAGGTTYILTATVDGKEHIANFKVTGTKTSKDSPMWSRDGNGTDLSTTMNNVSFEAGLCVASSYGGTWSGAAPALQNVYVRYWSVAENQYKTINLAECTPNKKGQLNGTNTTWTYSPDNGDFTLTVTGGQVHSSNKVSAMPVVCDGTLYFVAATSKGLVNSGNSARSIPVSYSFKDNNNGAELTGSHSWSVGENKDAQYSYSDFCNGTLKKLESGGGGGGCVTPDTLITLADGSQKRIDELGQDELIRVWNFEKGEYSVAPMAVLLNHGYDNNTEIALYFNDGTVTKAVNSHIYFDADLNKMVEINGNTAKDYIGHKFTKVTDNGIETVVLEDCTVEEKYIEAYTIVTAHHYNFIADGMISSTPSLSILPFEVDDNMKYDEVKIQEDIEKYGLYTYETFADYVTYEQYIAFNGAYLKVLVGKGYITFEEILELIATYVNPENNF